MPDNHYMHPRLAEVYNISDQPWPEEKEFYLSLGGPGPSKVLDLGCGVGNLAHGFRGAGHRVTGVDPAPAMLDVARGKPGGKAITWVQSRAQDFRSDERYDLIIMTGHAFQVLLTDEEILATLKTMRQHLAPGGRVGFETRNPDVDWEARWNERPDSTWELGVEDKVAISTTVLWRKGDLISFEHHYTFSDELLSSQSTLRFTSRQDLEALFGQAGLRIETCHGDWDRSPFDPEASPEMIFVTSKV